MNRTPLQEAAKRVWESLLEAHGHLTDLREVDGGEEAFHAIQRQLENAQCEVAEYLHEDDCND